MFILLSLENTTIDWNNRLVVIVDNLAVTLKLP